MKKQIPFIIRILGILLLTACGTEEYQPTLGTIEGIVINSVTKEAVYGCEVISTSQGVQHTDANGFFKFTDVPAGNLSLEYRCDGYETARQNINVQVGKTVNANISLTPTVSVNGIQANTSVLDFGASTSVLSLILQNVSDKSLNYTIGSETDWIVCSPSQGTIPAKGQSTVKVSVNRDEISEGHYEKTLRILSSENEFIVQVILEKGNLARPTVVTGDLTQDSGNRSAVMAKGAVTVIGSSNVTRHGFQYSKEPDMPEESVTSTNLGNLNSPAEFSGLITNLEFDVVYYIRAYATNSVGTSYGETKQIKLIHHDDVKINTLDATEIATNSVVFNGEVAQGSPEDLSECGFYYGTTAECNSKKAADTFTNEKRNFSVKLTDLQPSTTYYYRAYGVANGTEIIGELKTAKTSDSQGTTGTLTIVTGNATNIGPRQATLNGMLDNGSKTRYKEYGFFYGTNSNPTIRKIVNSYEGSFASINVGEFSQTIKDLEENQTYYYKAYVIDENNNIISGEVKSFVTTITPSIILMHGNITRSKNGLDDVYTLTLQADLNPQGKTIIEAGFITRMGYYDDYSVNAGYDLKLPCEIIDNKISFEKAYTEYSKYVYLRSGTYARAYMVLSDGTVIYSQDQGSNHGVYVGVDYPYNYQP
ncbi:MAG: carboxypeptidase regulatory-like domain-containing protein [Muribaculaceae bacterium]|nr:carboxypeptidase regulatory-like domain-containing protein [Muribaculaceae bacterium]